MTALRVGVAGAGSVACATAALLAERGHAPMLWSPSGAGTRALTAGGAVRAQGALDLRFVPAVAADAAALAARNDVLLLALPGYGHKAAFDTLAPHIRNGQTVIISSHASFGGLYLGGLLAARGVRATLICWGATIVTGRRRPDAADGAHVSVNSVRAMVDICALPDSAAPEALALCETLFGPRFRLRDGLLAITLSNLNPQNHMGIALANMTRMEQGEDWGQGRNVTPNVGRLLEALDAERLAIAAALGLEVRTIFEHFHLSFHVPVASVSDMNQAMHAQGNGGTGPTTADSRYVTEDAPYGLAVTAALGDLVGRPAPLHRAGVQIFSAMYGRDFAAENQLLSALNFDQISLERLKEAARRGHIAPIT